MSHLRRENAISTTALLRQKVYTSMYKALLDIHGMFLNYQMDSAIGVCHVGPVTCTFSSLPHEVREMIWLASFETRIVCLHIHQRIAPPYRDANGSELQGYQKTIAITFSSTVLTSSDPKDVDCGTPPTPDEVFQRHCETVRKAAKDHSGDIGTLAGRTSRGPVQLYVCHESRALALKRYQRAFAGIAVRSSFSGLLFRAQLPRGEPSYNLEEGLQIDRQTWSRRQLWEKRIWVDFERDVILVDTLKRGPQSRNFRSPMRPVDPLVLMRMYAKEEMKQIRRLAVGGRWVPKNCHPNDILNQIGSSLMGSQVSMQREARLLQGQPGNNARQGSKYEFLLGFDSLKELLIDDSFGNVKGTMKGKVLQDYRDGAEDVLKDAVKFFEFGKRMSEGLKWHTPELRVLRWDEWKNLAEEGT